MNRTKWICYLTYFLEKLKKDAVSAYAGQTAFFIIMSIFPFTMLVLTLVQYLPVNAEIIISMTRQIIPSAFDSYIVSLINEIYEKPLVTIVSVTFLGAIWAVSKSFLAVIRGCNFVYGIDETRNYVKLRLISSVYTILFAVIIAITLVVMVFGNTIIFALAKQFPFFNEMAKVIIVVRTILGFIVMFGFFLAVYVFVPNRKTKAVHEIPGAIVTTVGWIGFSYLYSFYIDHFANFDTYGSLTTMVFMMLWLYACMYIFFIGGEINVLWNNWDNIENFLVEKSK